MVKITAISFVNVEQRKFKQVADQLSKISGIKRIILLTGDYDMILEIEIEKMEDLWETFVNKIDPIEGIINTNTHIVMKEYRTD